MIPLSEQVEEAVLAAFEQVHPGLKDADPLVRRSDRAHFQSNAALSLAKRTQMRPGDLAKEAASVISTSKNKVIADITVSGPGFLNITMTDDSLWRQVGLRATDPRLGIGKPEIDQRVVIDYSGPNIAKEMHVGHLRTTIVGDCLARVFDHLGATVIRQNHLGDWGTQFGMLIQYIDEHPNEMWRHTQLGIGSNSVSALDQLYRSSRQMFDNDPQFADRARARVVALQGGDETTLRVWKEIVQESEFAFQELYQRLGVLLERSDSFGESAYNAWLNEVTDELITAGVATQSDGAIVVQSLKFKGAQDEPAVLMVRKRDGGYGYDTTDLATIRYRLFTLKADRILYVVDARQSLHFQLIFETAKRMNWLQSESQVTHVAFGAVLGPDGRPFKTRSGETVKLMKLLDEAVSAARNTVAEKATTLTSDELELIAEQAGIGAVKYADLSTSRTKDYAFDVSRMVSLNGNTSVYLQYAHARICSILRRANEQTPMQPYQNIPMEPVERDLVLALDEFGVVICEVATSFEPHKLCTYLFETAKTFTTFYEQCPVLNAPDEIRRNRIILCKLTAETLRSGLGMLGIAAPERM